MSALRKSAAALAGLVTLLAAAGPTRPSPPTEPTMLLTSGDHRGGHHQPVRFTVAGTSVRGLYPGAVKQIKLKITNPYSFALVVHNLSGKVTATSRRGCPVSLTNIQVGAFTGRLPLTVAARSRVVLTGTLPVTMPRQATEGCADTRFTIKLVGTGRKATR